MGEGTATSVKENVKQHYAPMYKVLIHDDPQTTMEFVTSILIRIFHKDKAEASNIMMETHNKGIALITVEPLEQAEFHVDQVHSLARAEGFPLTLTYEPDDN